MTYLKNLLLLALVATVLSSCGDDEPIETTNELTLNLSGLENLGTDFAYEGWIIVDGNPVSTGVFNVDDNGNPDQSTFDIDAETLEKATTFVLTIEPSPDSDPAPSDVHILAGDFADTNAPLTVDHGAALGSDFTASAGSYILATPTDGNDMDENSGVWFLDLTSGSPARGLDLPTLPAGWAYEGWAVIDGTPVSTGTFTEIDKADNGAAYSGQVAGPPYPGEDFLTNAPGGLTFPTDLAGKTVVISIEPSPDNSAAPFLLKPLVGQVPADALDHTTYSMDNNAQATNPTGTARR